MSPRGDGGTAPAPGASRREPGREPLAAWLALAVAVLAHAAYSAGSYPLPVPMKAILLFPGTGMGALGPATASTLVARGFGPRRGLALGILHGGDNLVNGFIPPATAALLVGLGWRATAGVPGGVIFHLVPHQTDLGIPIETASRTFGLLIVAGFLGSLAIGAAADRWRPTALLVAVQAGLAGGALALGTVVGPLALRVWALGHGLRQAAQGS